MAIYQITAQRRDVYSILVAADSPAEAWQKVLDNDFDGSDAACVDQGEWIPKNVQVAEE